MRNKILLVLFIVLAVIPVHKTNAKERTLVKIPFQDREDILRGMRRYLNQTQGIMMALSKKDFDKVESIASNILLDDERLVRLGTRENDQFMAQALEFHTLGVSDVIKSARTKSVEKTLVSMSNFIGRCNACHENFRLLEWSGKDYPPAKSKVLIPPKGFNRNDWIKKI